MTAEESGDKTTVADTSDIEHDPQFAPIVQLPEVSVPTHEEDEIEILKLRGRLYRFDKSGTVSEWKERGTGELKLLKHDVNKTVRFVMRRDKTLKVCGNHFITPLMNLKPMPGMDRVFIYTSPADFTYEQVQSECFAIKFATVEIANQFKEAFLDAQKYVQTECRLYNGEADEDDSDYVQTDSDDNECSEEKSSDEFNTNNDNENDEAKIKTDERPVEEVTEKLENLDVTNRDDAKK